MTRRCFVPGCTDIYVHQVQVCQLAFADLCAKHRFEASIDPELMSLWNKAEEAKDLLDMVRALACGGAVGVRKANKVLKESRQARYDIRTRILALLASRYVPPDKDEPVRLP